MSSDKQSPSEIYESIAQDYPNTSWADSRCDRRFTEKSEEDEQTEKGKLSEQGGQSDSEHTEGVDYIDIYRGYTEGSEKDGNYITRKTGTGSRDGEGDSYEDEYTNFTKSDLGEAANKQDSAFTSCMTDFKVKEAPEHKKNKFERLKKLNIGVRENWWRQYDEFKDTLRDARFFAERLNLPDYQIEEVVLHTGNLDFQGGRRKEHQILALITIIDDKYMEIPEDADEEEYEKCMKNRVSETEMFHSFLDSVEMNKSELMQVRQMVRDQVPYVTGNKGAAANA